jgi:uncharacterized protein YodC (DUF2158 family)
MTEPLTISFQPGDVVTLKSGGPAMTVIASKDDGVHCVWYAEGVDEVKTEIVPAVCLEKALPFDEDDEDDDDDDGRPKKHGKKKRHDDD